MSLSASFLFVFLSIFKLSKIYGPLLIGSMFTMCNSFSSWAIIFSSCSSVISNPAPTKISPLLSFTSFAIYFPTIWSLGIAIEDKPFSLS